MTFFQRIRESIKQHILPQVRFSIRQYFLLPPEVADSKAIESDWQIVGNDMQIAIDKFAKENPEIKID